MLSVASRFGSWMLKKNKVSPVNVFFRSESTKNMLQLCHKFVKSGGEKQVYDYPLVLFTKWLSKAPSLGMSRMTICTGCFSDVLPEIRAVSEHHV